MPQIVVEQQLHTDTVLRGVGVRKTPCCPPETPRLGRAAKGNSTPRLIKVGSILSVDLIVMNSPSHFSVGN